MEGDRAGALGKSPAAPGAQLPTGPVVQQRFFVGDMQRFNMVEINSATTAGEVVEMIDAQGGLQGVSGSGGWMVFEVAQDFGMGQSSLESKENGMDADGYARASH